MTKQTRLKGSKQPRCEIFYLVNIENFFLARSDLTSPMRGCDAPREEQIFCWRFAVIGQGVKLGLYLKNLTILIPLELLCNQ